LPLKSGFAVHIAFTVLEASSFLDNISSGFNTVLLYETNCSYRELKSSSLNKGALFSLVSFNASTLFYKILA
jgi:hypothetical protein